ncbi:MAG: methyltransferase domain-containing protein [Pseudomonadota bacterium]
MSAAGGANGSADSETGSETDAFDPDALGALYADAREAEDSGDHEKAIALFNACLLMDPADHCGVSLRLAALGAAAPQRAPAAYVATLFDQTAPRFDAVLVGQLGYDVPALARRLVARHQAPSTATRLLDVGCGTGLVGLAFQDDAGEMIGLDLSEDMLAFADERGTYADLYVGDAVSFMDEWDEAPFDLIVAADVLPYLGDLTPFMAAAAHALRPGGLLAASTERCDAGWAVTATQRFAHSTLYVTGVMGAAGLDLLAAEPITVRHEEGSPVLGDLLLGQKRPSSP